MIFEIISLVILIIGSICGAGLISGSEIWIFFAKYGNISIIFALLFGFVFWISIKKVFYLKIKYGLKNIDDLSKVILPKCPFIVKYFFSIIYLFFGAVMFAGLQTINPLLMWVSAIVSIIIITFNIKSVSWVNIILIPLVILYIILLFLFNIDSLGLNIIYRHSIFSFVQVVYYASINFLLVINYILNSKVYTKKHIDLVAIISSAVCVICIILISFMISNRTSMLSLVPLFDFAKYNNFCISIISTIILFISIFTTLICCLYSLVVNIDCRKKVKIIYLVGIVFVMIIISYFGLGNVLSYGYNFIGFIGFSFLTLIWSKK